MKRQAVEMRTLVLLTLGSVVVMIGTNVYWLLEPETPPSVSIEQSARNGKGEPQTAFKAGDVLWIFSRQRVLREVPRLALQSIWSTDTNSLVARYPALVSPTPPPQGILFPVIIPDYLLVGNYEHRVTIRYRLNPMRIDAEFDLPPVKFRIVK